VDGSAKTWEKKGQNWREEGNSPGYKSWVRGGDKNKGEREWILTTKIGGGLLGKEGYGLDASSRMGKVRSENMGRRRSIGEQCAR